MSDNFNQLLNNFNLSQAEYSQKQQSLANRINSNNASAQREASSMAQFANSFADTGMDGVAKAGINGFAAGMGMATDRKNEEEQRKFQEVTDYWQAANGSMKQELQQIQMQNAAKEKVKPYMSAYLKNMGNMSATDRKVRADRIMDISNHLLGENDKLISIDGDNPAIWTIESGETGEAAVADMAMAFAGDQAAELEYAQYQTSNIDKRKKEAAQQVVDNQHIFKQDTLARDKFNYDSNPEKQGEKAFMVEKQETLGSKLMEYKQIAQSKENVVKAFDRMQKLVNKNSWIFDYRERNFAEWMTPDYESGTISFKENIARALIGHDDERIDVIKAISKDYSNILFDRVQSQKLGRMTNDIMQMDSKGLPLPWRMTKESFNETVDVLKSNYINEKNILDREINQGERVLSGIGQLFTVKNPNTGITERLDKQEMQKAIKKGYILE